MSEVKKVKDSIVATGKGKIKNSSINKTKFHKPSFWKGFLTGILSSFIASLIFNAIMK